MIYDKTSVGTIRSIAVTKADNEELRKAYEALISAVKADEEAAVDEESIPDTAIPPKIDV